MLNLNRYSITVKLTLFFMIPLCTIIIFALTTAHNKYQKLEGTLYVNSALDVVSVLDELIYGLQKERGLTAGIVASAGTNPKAIEFESLLSEQRIINDAIVIQARNKIKKLERFFSPKMAEKWQFISAGLSNLASTRLLDERSQHKDSFQKYSQIISSILNFIEYTQTYIDDHILNNLASSFVSLEWIKEHAGLERGALNKALFSGKLNSSELKSIFSDIIGQEAAYKRFKNLTLDENQYHVNSKIVDGVNKDVEHYRKILFSKVIKESTFQNHDQLPVPFKQNPELWWNDSTKRIDALHASSRNIIKDMSSRAKSIEKDAQVSLFAHTVLALLTIIICLYLALKIRARLVGEIGYIANSMREISALTSEHKMLRVQGNDEIADMVHAFNNLIQQRSLNENNLRLAAQVFKGAHEGILITDLKSTIIDVNPIFCEITGFSREEVIGNTPNMWSSGKHPPEFYQQLWQEVTNNGYWHGEIWNRKKDGEIFPEILTITSLINEQNEVNNYVAIFTDISELKNQQQQLELLAYFDPLTRVPNRTLFADRFAMASALCKRNKSLLAICFLDLDDFKPVNDKYGHDIGDLLLVSVADRITSTLRESDSVSRQGGDEFIVLLGDVFNTSQIEKLLDRLLYCVTQPYFIEGHYISVSVTAGISIYPSDNDNLDTLIRHADQAMYKAKLKGKRRYSFYNLEEDQKTINKHHHLQELKDAILHDEFELYYQPKINMVTGQTYGVEALIRWNKPNAGLVPPLEFLPIIEGTKLDIEIGDWVINTALTQAEKWLSLGISLELSINISPHHLLSDVFFDQLESALSKHPSVDSEQLQIEILESEVISDVTKVAKVMKECRRKLGVHFALDDFGTGYSSLSHLRDLPAKTIKIDQSFVRNILNDANNFPIIDSVIGLADSFGRGVIAEGVETIEHGLMLLLMGCNDAQGYGIAKPMPAKEFPGWIESYSTNQSWIEAGKKKLSPTEASLKRFNLSINYWFNHFKQGLLSTPKTVPEWTVQPYSQCLCGEWIKRAKLKKTFDSQWLAELENLHKAIHNQANQLYNYSIVGELHDPHLTIRQLEKLMVDINHLTRSFQPHMRVIHSN